MTILSIGYTRDLLEDGVYSDTKERLLFYSNWIDKYFVIAHSLKRHQLKPRKLAHNFDVIPSNGWNKIHSFIRIISIGADICSREHVDLIQVQEPVFTGLAGRILSFLYKIPLNTIVYGANPYDEHWSTESTFNRITEPLAKYILKKSHGIQVDGSQTMRSLIKNGINLSKTFLKPMIPVDSDNFYNAEGSDLRQNLLKSEYDKIILFVGRLEKQKNLALYLNVIKKILTNFGTRILFVIIGSGSEENSLKKLAEDLSIDKNLLWIPQVSRSEIPSYFAASDIFVLPSLYEGFARVLMEAAMAGKPIVTTAVSGSDDALIHEETGFIIEVNDEIALEDKIIALLKDKDMADKMGKQGQKLMKERYSSEKTLWKQIEIWQQIIKAK